jgi:anti-sigma regulatory factor (Ser/Thr protein kinase)
MVAALGLTVESSRIHMEKPQAASAHYLVRMGLFDILKIPCGISIHQHAPEGRFIPLTQIRTSEELAEFISEMIPCLHEPEHAKTIGYIISELGRNVIEHSDSSDGAIMCAQYFQKSNSIRIGISDTGVGIKKSINRSYPVTSSLDAIRLALWPGVTGVTRKPGGTEQNAGAGLFFIRAIANVNRDHFIIYSGGAFYKLLKTKEGKKLNLNADPFKDRHSKSENFPYWQGTLVGIDITLDKTQEYSSLLSAIQKIYWKLRKIKTAYKKPIFI